MYYVGGLEDWMISTSGRKRRHTGRTERGMAIVWVQRLVIVLLSM